MSQFRQISYSVGIGVIITASLIFLSALGVGHAGVWLTPGIFGELILTTLLPFGDGEAFSFTHQAWAANLVFYLLSVYASLSLIRAIGWFAAELKAEKQNLSGTAQSNKRLERTRR
jgi:lysylphosphatidylglycerol synthetase-like protein (DUF2156 family)